MQVYGRSLCIGLTYCFGIRFDDHYYAVLSTLILAACLCIVELFCIPLIATRCQTEDVQIAVKLQ